MTTDESNNMNTSKSKTIIALLLYCISGTLLTLVNKLAVVVFPYINVLLVLQNGTILSLQVLGFYFFHDTLGPMPPLNFTIVKFWVPLSLLFVMILMSSLASLLYVSVPSVIMMHRLSTISVALLEYIVLGNKVNGVGITTLICMALAAMAYVKHDLTFNILGYAWLCINIIGTTLYEFYNKRIIDIPQTKDITRFGILYYINLISLPVLFILACIMGEFTTLSLHFSFMSFFKLKSIGVVLLSCILGLLLRTTAFELNKLVSAASLMVAKNANKFFIIVISEIFVQPTLDIIGFITAIFVLFLGWLYSQTTKPFAKPLLIVAVFIAVMGSFSQYQYTSTRVFDIGMNFPLSDIKQAQMIIDKKKAKGDEIYKSYLPLPTSHRVARRMPPGVFVKNTTSFQLSEICLNKNSSIWNICDAKRCDPYNGTIKLDYPRTTTTGENTGEFVNRVLEVAWGSNPPSIDLYLRSGCNGILEMKYLFESIEIFWPRFLGSVVIVLDAGDEVILKHLLPANPTHHYLIAFEHLPCLPGRVFNQYSYLNLDRHCTAEYVVTIDSDCAFHSPVTPDLIFREGRVILASSLTFQADMWGSSVELIMDAGMYYGHYMVTQPVTFALSTFSFFRQWFSASKGICYEDRLSQYPPRFYSTFCWMCQLGTYLERGNSTQNDYKQYWYHHLDDTSLEPLLRYATHVTYELYRDGPCDQLICYEKSVTEIIKQGLCRAFGSSIFDICANYSNLAYVNEVTFLYAHTEIQPKNDIARANALSNYLKRVSNATAIVLNKFS